VVFFLLHLVSNDVKLHTSFFLLHLLSNDIQLHTSFQTKLNPLKIVHVFFSHCIGSNHVNLRKYSLLLKQQCTKSFKIPKRKGRQCNGQREKDNHRSTKHYTKNYHFPHSDIFFHRKQKSDFYFLNIKKRISNFPSNFYHKFLVENCRAGLMIFFHLSCQFILFL
jgi:hypothetical protein